MKTIVLILCPALLLGSAVENMACATFIHGVPYSLIIALPKNTDPTVELVDILKNSSKQRCWANATSMIGVLGNENQVGLLTDLVYRGKGVISEFEWDTKLSAVFSLGLLANKGGHKGLAFLGKLVKTIDQTESFPWDPPPVIGRKNLRVLMARAAVQALGVSGRQEAKVFLLGIKDKRLTDVVSDALLSNKIVADQGLAGLYK